MLKSGTFAYGGRGNLALCTIAQIYEALSVSGGGSRPYICVELDAIRKGKSSGTETLHEDNIYHLVLVP